MHVSSSEFTNGEKIGTGLGAKIWPLSSTQLQAASLLLAVSTTVHQQSSFFYSFYKTV